MTQKERDRQEAREKLRAIIQPGDTVYTILRHVSRSGMTRRISVVVVRDGEAVDISWRVAPALGYPLKDGALVVRGCGMDMGYDIVHHLAYALFGRDGSLHHSWL